MRLRANVRVRAYVRLYSENNVSMNRESWWNLLRIDSNKHTPGDSPFPMFILGNKNKKK